MIRTIIFDCFGVLYKPRHKRYYEQLLTEYPTHSEEIENLRQQTDYGFIDEQALYVAIATFTNTSLETVRQNLKNDYVRDEQVISYAQQLRSRYKVSMLSNCSAQTLQEIFNRTEQVGLFDDVLVSSDVGMVKPYPEIFILACHRLDVDVSETIMIDDSEENCEGARRAGLQAVLYQSFSQARQALEELIANSKN